MSWPTRTWTADGWKDFKTPGTSKPTGFPDDWKQHESSEDNSSYWDVIENPLYEAAANASGIDWQQFVDESFAEIGTELSGKTPAEGWFQDEETGLWGKSISGLPGTINPFGGGWQEEPEYVDKYDEGYQAGLNDGTFSFGQLGQDEDAIDWGIDRNRFGSIAEDLDTMHEWLGKTIKTHALQDAPIIRRGPEGSDYGIDGDIWEHYGLDKPPAPPKEMDVNYEFNLIAAKPSSKSYATPEGYPTLDTSTESIPYEDTHYAKWQTEQDKAYDKWEDKWGNTSYGEPIITSTASPAVNPYAHIDTSNLQFQDKYVTRTVDKLGLDNPDQAKLWAVVAGVGNLNQDSDIRTIKNKYEKLDGKLPT